MAKVSVPDSNILNFLNRLSCLNSLAIEKKLLRTLSSESTFIERVLQTRRTDEWSCSTRYCKVCFLFLLK